MPGPAHVPTPTCPSATTPTRVERGPPPPLQTGSSTPSTSLAPAAGDRSRTSAPRQCRAHGRGPFRLKHLQAFLLILLDDQELVQLRNLEDLVNLRVDVAQDQLAADALKLLV